MVKHYTLSEVLTLPNPQQTAKDSVNEYEQERKQTMSRKKLTVLETAISLLLYTTVNDDTTRVTMPLCEELTKQISKLFKQNQKEGGLQMFKGIDPAKGHDKFVIVFDSLGLDYKMWESTAKQLGLKYREINKDDRVMEIKK